MEGVEVLVIDLLIVLIEVDHPVSSLPGHFRLPFLPTSDLSAQLVTLAGCMCGEVPRRDVEWAAAAGSTADTSFGHGEGEWSTTSFRQAAASYS